MFQAAAANNEYTHYLDVLRAVGECCWRWSQTAAGAPEVADFREMVRTTGDDLDKTLYREDQNTSEWFASLHNIPFNEASFKKCREVVDSAGAKWTFTWASFNFEESAPHLKERYMRFANYGDTLDIQRFPRLTTATTWEGFNEALAPGRFASVGEFLEAFLGFLLLRMDFYFELPLFAQTQQAVQAMIREAMSAAQKK